MLKKLGVIFIVCCMIVGLVPAQAAYERAFSVWDGSVTANWYDQSTNYRNKTLQINSAADFIAFRNAVWSGTNYPAWGGGPNYNFWQCTVQLNCDIDLNNINLAFGIGGVDNNTAFMGIFNGNGHIIKNIKINPNEPDGAVVQPAENIKTNANAAENNKNRIGLFGTLVGDNDDNSLNGGRIANLHLENVEITLPNASAASAPVYVGAMAGYMYNKTDIYSSSVKNVEIKGGPQTPVQGQRYIIGGMVGAINTGTVKNSYVNGINFKELIPGYHCAWMYKAGMANVEGTVRLMNIYSANVSYSDLPYEYNGQPYSHSTLYYDSLLNPIGSTAAFTPVASTVAAYSDAPKRITSDANNGITETSDITLAEGSKIGTLSTGSSFLGDGDLSYMIDMSTFNGGYAATGSEKMLVGRGGKLIEGESEVLTAAAANGKEIAAQFEILNSTQSAQTVDIILAGYKDGMLKDIKCETLTVPATAGKVTYNQAEGLGYLLSGRKNGYSVINSTVTITSDNYDMIKAFCWNGLSGLMPIAKTAAAAE